MQRPTGVVIIAVLYWIGAFGLLILGCFMFLGSAAIGTMAATGLGTLFSGLGTIGGIIVLAIAAAMALVGYGLFQLKEWARVTVIALSALGILIAFISFFTFTGMFLFGKLIRLAISALVIWYLMQPQVRVAFAR